MEVASPLKTGVHRYIHESVSSHGVCFPIPCSQGPNVLDGFSTSPSPRPVRSKRQNAQVNRLETCSEVLVSSFKVKYQWISREKKTYAGQ